MPRDARDSSNYVLKAGSICGGYGAWTCGSSGTSPPSRRKGTSPGPPSGSACSSLPLSQQIKAIEQELDAQLFRRKARGVELTDAGRVLLDQARAVLERLDHALLLTRRTARGEQGRLLVGIAPTAPFHPFVPQAIRAFRQAHPLVSVTLEECLSRQAIEQLHGERIDVAFLRAPVADPQGLTVHSLLEEPMVVALPSSHELAGGGFRSEPLPLRALAGENFILFGGSAGPGIADASLAACHGPASVPASASRRLGSRRHWASSPSGLGSRWSRPRSNGCEWTGWPTVACCPANGRQRS